MPAKNSIKLYVENGYYHIYNRGVNKNNVFLEEVDYRFFLYLLKIYLSNPITSKQLILENSSKFLYIPKNFFDKITLVAYVLMPNHFHILVRQTAARSIESFMRALMIKYTMYLNSKYSRIGPLFQGRYKGILITSDAYLLHISRYIHRNPIDLDSQKLIFSIPWRSYRDYPFSSYRWYLSNIKLEWFNPSSILDFFNSKPVWIPKDVLSYQSFVSNYKKGFPSGLKTLLLDK